MGYIFLLSGFLLSATCSPVDNKFSPLTENASIFSTIRKQNVDGTTNLLDGEHSFKTINRQRRSMWTAIIDQIAENVEKLHIMEPALAEGVNNVEVFNTNFKSKLNSRYNSANVMLSEGEGGGKSESFELVHDIKSAMGGTTLTKDEWKKADKGVNELYFTYKKIVKRERRFLKDLIDLDWDDIRMSYIAHLYKKLSSDDKSIKILRYLIKKYPNEKGPLIKNIAEVRKMRQELLKHDKSLEKLINGRYLGETLYKEKTNMKLDKLMLKNRAWLKYKMDPEFVE